MDKKTALIVDDSSLARMLMRKIFTTSFQEWNILEAKDGEDALSRLDGVAIQLALIDFNMPGMNGLELAEKIIEKRPSLSIHLVTANIQERMKQRAEAMGVGFVKKPVNQQILTNLIDGLNK